MSSVSGGGVNCALKRGLQSEAGVRAEGQRSERMKMKRRKEKKEKE